MSMIKMHIRDINAVCDFILEASDWAASLALLPEEQRGDRPLFGLPVIFIIENMIIIVGISCRSWLKTVRLGVSNQLTSRKNITLSISSPGFCEGVFSRERLRRHHWSCPGSPQLNHQNTFPQYIDQPASEDCHFVASLKELGAIPFCLTNVPQTMVNIVTWRRWWW